MSELFINNIKRQKTIAESQYVSTLYASPELCDEYKVDPKMFTSPHWRFFYQLLLTLTTKQSVKVIDEMSIELYMESANPKAREFYEASGGWETIDVATQIIEVENIESYYREMIRYSAILKLINSGFDVEEKWDVYKNLTYQELSDAVTASVDTIFSEIDMGEDRVVDIMADIQKTIDDADKGVQNGLPLASKLLNSLVNGLAVGNVTMIAGQSGVGKTFITLNQLLPSFIKTKERLLIMCNEEDIGKWQIEMLVWQINNVQKKDMVKSRFFEGRFTNDEKEWLENAKNWLSEMMNEELIMFTNFSTFAMSKAIKLIRKFATTDGIKYFVIDTLKLDNDLGTNVSDLAWLQLQQNMVKLYNVIKPSSKNVHVWVTYQMNKSVKTRYLTQGDLGMSKNVADVVSTLILIRDVYETEKGSGGKSLTVKSDKGAEIVLNEDSEYMVAFIDKNRRGSTSEQVVWRVDKGRNIMKDVGKTKIAQDF